MFSAHVVLADVDHHSQLDFPARTEQLETFWDVCDRSRPCALADSPCSFYEVNNDSLVVGLSDVPGLTSGTDVLRWVIGVQGELSDKGIPVTFAVNLLAIGRPIQWRSCPGFRDDRGMLYTPDDVFEAYGRVQQSRVAGDALIVAARLLALAKAADVRIALSVLRGGHLREDIRRTRHIGGLEDPIWVSSLSWAYDMLDAAHAEWLRERGVEAWGLDWVGARVGRSHGDGRG